jgi:DNA replication protein DnaC
LDFFDKPRELKERDLQRMLIPQEFRKTELSDIQADSFRSALGNYINGMRSMFQNRVGLYIWGPPASGKGAAAAVIAKEARRRYKPGMFIAVHELRETLVSRKMYDVDTSPMARAKDVDMLVLDGLEDEDRDEKLLSLTELARLITTRARQHKLTVLTSRISPGELTNDSKFKRFWDEVEQYMLPIHAPDPTDAKLARREMMRKLVLGDDA